MVLSPQEGLNIKQLTLILISPGNPQPLSFNKTPPRMWPQDHALIHWQEPTQ